MSYTATILVLYVMNSIKACYVAQNMLFPSIEGHHVASKRIIEAAILSGIDTSVITKESGLKNLKVPKNWTIIDSRFSPRMNFWFLSSVFSAMDDLITSVDVTSHIKSSGYDLIHVLNVNKEAYLLIHTLRRIKNPLLMHFYHSPHVLADDIFFIRNIAFKMGLFGRKLHNHLLTVNSSLYNYCIEKLGIDREHVHYAPYPVDTDKFKPMDRKEFLCEKYGLPTSSPIVVYVGSLNPVRGIFNLIKSFKIVSAKFQDALLYVSHPQRKGEVTYERRLQESIKLLKLDDKVFIHGPIAHVEEIYNLADLVVLPFIRPYWVDPPIVLLEAMSCGSTIITTPVGAISELTKNEENAVLARKGNSRILAEVMIEFMSNTDESRKIGQEARKTIIQNYSYETAGKRLLEIYDSVRSLSSKS